VDVQLPEPLVVEPDALTWKKGESYAPKTLAVRPADGIRVGKTTITNASFKLSEEAALKSGGSVIEIDPRDAEPPLSALLRIAYEGRSSGTVAIPIRLE
jgi:hypothetical protein